jgi:hypothetical protein
VGLPLGIAASSSEIGPRPDPVFDDQDFDQSKGVSGFENHWYSKHLTAMDEPLLANLSLRDRDAIIYRWLWLPSFNHPVYVRIDRSHGGARLHLIVLSGLGGYGPGHVAIEKSIPLHRDEWERIAQKLNEMGYWSMPTHEKRNFGVQDATHLVWEGVGPGNYHVIVREYPVPRNEVSFFLSLVERAGIDTRKIGEKSPALR